MKLPSLSDQRGLTTVAILAIVVGSILALTGIGFAGYKILDGSDQPKPQNASEGTSQERSGEPSGKEGEDVTAESLSDFSEVCKGKKITNAAAYADGPRPHPITFFRPGVVADSYISPGFYFKETGWLADFKEFDATQLVGCFERKSTEFAKKCQLKDVSLDLHSVKYELTVYEAKTGKEVEKREVNGPAGPCPMITTYDKDDPKIFADPNFTETRRAVEPLITR